MRLPAVCPSNPSNGGFGFSPSSAPRSDVVFAGPLVQARRRRVCSDPRCPTSRVFQDEAMAVCFQRGVRSLHRSRGGGRRARRARTGIRRSPTSPGRSSPGVRPPLTAAGRLPPRVGPVATRPGPPWTGAWRSLPGVGRARTRIGRSADRTGRSPTRTGPASTPAGRAWTGAVRSPTGTGQGLTRLGRSSVRTDWRRTHARRPPTYAGRAQTSTGPGSTGTGRSSTRGGQVGNGAVYSLPRSMLDELSLIAGRSKGGVYPRQLSRSGLLPQDPQLAGRALPTAAPLFHPT